MTSIEHTTYLRLKRTLTPKELDHIYTPTPAEIFLAHRTAKGPVATLGFLVHLKQGFTLLCKKTQGKCNSLLFVLTPT